jgi:hypothetical protein
LTAYLLDVKVFVWFNPSILVTGPHPLPKGRRAAAVVCLLFSPHEIGKSEELRESELPGVGRRFGDFSDRFGGRTFDRRKRRKKDS